jgi:hypothetical protein
MINGPPDRGGPQEDRNSKAERLVRNRSSTRTASPFANDELTFLWGEFIAARNRAHETLNIADGITAGRRFRLFLEAAAYRDRRGVP